MDKDQFQAFNNKGKHTRLEQMLIEEERGLLPDHFDEMYAIVDGTEIQDLTDEQIDTIRIFAPANAAFYEVTRNNALREINGDTHEFEDAEEAVARALGLI